MPFEKEFGPYFHVTILKKDSYFRVTDQKSAVSLKKKIHGFKFIHIMIRNFFSPQI